MTEAVVHELVTVTADEAGRLEEEFLNGLDQAQDAFVQIMETNAWAALGHDSFAAWWEQRVVPVMRALALRPSREIADRVLEQVRQEEASLPAAQRRRGSELADLVGTSEWVVEGRQDQRPPRSTAKPDLDDPVTRPDPDQPEDSPAEAPLPGLDDEDSDSSDEAEGIGVPEAGDQPGSASPTTGAGPGTPQPQPPAMPDTVDKDRAHAARVSDDLRRLVTLAQSFGTPELQRRAVDLYDDKLGNAPLPPRGAMNAEAIWKASEAVAELAAAWEERR